MLPRGSLEENMGYRHPFMFGTIYLGGIGDNPRTLVDLAMSYFSAHIRRKPEWWTRYRDKEARREWYDEVLERRWDVRGPSSMFKIQLSPRQVRVLKRFDELEGYATLRDERNGCEVSCFERIWESHTLVPPSFVASFLAELFKLKNDFPQWGGHHQNTEHTVIDPLLHCLVYNRTLVRALPAVRAASAPSRVRDVLVSPTGECQFKSYINNINPEIHEGLYHLLSNLLTSSLPLFEHVLTDLHRNNPLSLRIYGPCRYNVWEEPEEPEHSDDEAAWARYEKEMRQWTMNRPLQLPDVPITGYRKGTVEGRRHTVNLKGRQLQVFVRVSQIHLIPRGPEYSGTDWHVEGMRTERIVACTHHFLQSENITTSSLQFRMAVSYPRQFIAGDTGATLRTWGLNDGDGCQQYVGSVPISASPSSTSTPPHVSTSICFPNIYQCQLTRFRLLDSSKDGHLTIVSFLLVDPDIRPIVSTSNVPPQQSAWIRDALYDALMGRIPGELIEAIWSEVLGSSGTAPAGEVAGIEGQGTGESWVMTPDDAEGYRSDYVGVLERFTQASNNYHFCIPFDVWNSPEMVL
ncbi:hypothetical protein NMY22_g12762 [Coprinellus aureogranulatus]|nr:hypothetical protein NMY22_g12762 [Coprinellus aureogranulatus]